MEEIYDIDLNLLISFILEDGDTSFCDFYYNYRLKCIITVYSDHLRDKRRLGKVAPLDVVLVMVLCFSLQILREKKKICI